MTGHVVAVAITDRIPIFELATPCEVFGIDRRDLADPWYQLRLCAAEPGVLRTVAGLRVETRYGLADLAAADTVLVPACGTATMASPPRRLLEALRAAHRRGARIASICTGAYVLAAAGLLDGRRATTHWMQAADFARRWPAITLDPGVLYVDDGDILTSAGTGAGIDLCLHLIRLDHGAAVSNAVARRMVIPPHRDGGQAQYLPLAPVTANGTTLAPVLEWARQRLDQPLTVAALARQANMSERTLARRFADAAGVSPLRWLTQQRIRLAQELLETTDEPVEAIARRSGFGTAVNLRQHFGRATSISPQAYRRTFRHNTPAPAPGKPAVPSS
jgi:transcriptional regulator GlxA family with amidase domain